MFYVLIIVIYIEGFKGWSKVYLVTESHLRKFETILTVIYNWKLCKRELQKTDKTLHSTVFRIFYSFFYPPSTVWKTKYET